MLFVTFACWDVYAMFAREKRDLIITQMISKFELPRRSPFMSKFCALRGSEHLGGPGGNHVTTTCHILYDTVGHFIHYCRITYAGCNSHDREDAVGGSPDGDRTHDLSIIIIICIILSYAQCKSFNWRKICSFETEFATIS